LFEIEVTIDHHREKYYFKSNISKLHKQLTSLIVYMQQIDSSKIKVNFYLISREGPH